MHYGYNLLWNAIRNMFKKEVLLSFLCVRGFFFVLYQ